MSALRQLLERNRQHAVGHSEGRPAVEPTLRAVILACVDHRSDPAHVLALAPKEAAVVRNPGGRVTESFIHHLAVLATVAAVEGMDVGFELIVMHHSDCGVSRLASPHHAELVASMFGVVGTAPHTVLDPEVTVVEDIATLRAHPLVPGTLVVGGLVHDLDTGRVRAVVEPAPLAMGGRR